uniref:Uncharacterized protein n=1 Tax=viral metagenome TaxID=1070528 RepID=A0A6M3J100_9ZZZZ
MNQLIIKFELDKECKHSRRYSTKDKDAVIQSIYIKRPFAERKTKITLLIQETKE